MIQWSRGEGTSTTSVAGFNGPQAVAARVKPLALARTMGGPPLLTSPRLASPRLASPRLQAESAQNTANSTPSTAIATSVVGTVTNMPTYVNRFQLMSRPLSRSSDCHITPASAPIMVMFAARLE